MIPWRRGGSNARWFSRMAFVVSRRVDASKRTEEAPSGKRRCGGYAGAGRPRLGPVKA